MQGESPRDRLLFDTGHQAYVHKIVTGRQDGFDLLRQLDGRGYETIHAELAPPAGIGAAHNDRLTRAAAR